MWPVMNWMLRMVGLNKNRTS